MKVKVKVPATSANLGPGFDVAGLAVTLYNTFVFELLEDGLEITGCPQQFCNQDNLTYRAFVEGAKEGLIISFNIFPSIIAMVFAINIFLDSRFVYEILGFLKPLLNLINIPIEIMPMAI